MSMLCLLFTVCKAVERVNATPGLWSWGFGGRGGSDVSSTTLRRRFADDASSPPTPRRRFADAMNSSVAADASPKRC